MHERNVEQKTNYFRELALNLQRESFAVCPEKDSLLPMKLEDGRLESSCKERGDLVDSQRAKAAAGILLHRNRVVSKL